MDKQPNANFTSPETLIRMYDFSTLPLVEGSLDLVKMALINYYNNQTLKSYETTGNFLNPLNICLEIPAKVKDLYQTRPELFTKNPVVPVQEGLVLDLIKLDAQKSPPRTATTPKPRTGGLEKPTVSDWVKDTDTVKKFAEFIKTEYELSDQPSTKFMDLLKAFAAKTGARVGDRWNAKYEPLMKDLGIKFEKVVNPRYENNGGTMYVCLKSKTYMYEDVRLDALPKTEENQNKLNLFEQLK